MAKLKEVTQARNLLRDAEEITIIPGESFHLSIDGSVPRPGPYKIIPTDVAAAQVEALTRADARTKLDPTARAKRKPKPKPAARKPVKKAARRKVK